MAAAAGGKCNGVGHRQAHNWYRCCRRRALSLLRVAAVEFSRHRRRHFFPPPPLFQPHLFCRPARPPGCFLDSVLAPVVAAAAAVAASLKVGWQRDRRGRSRAEARSDKRWARADVARPAADRRPQLHEQARAKERRRAAGLTGALLSVAQFSWRCCRWRRNCSSLKQFFVCSLSRWRCCCRFCLR